MIVNVNVVFANKQYDKMIEELYLITICKSSDKSSYTLEERQKDNFLKSILNDSCK
jgi:hypothetical protein